jgi:hypothetical protein
MGGGGGGGGDVLGRKFNFLFSAPSTLDYDGFHKQCVLQKAWRGIIKHIPVYRTLYRIGFENVKFGIAVYEPTWSGT